MSPRSTLPSCGSSSRWVARSQRPSPVHWRGSTAQLRVPVACAVLVELVARGRDGAQLEDARFPAQAGDPALAEQQLTAALQPDQPGQHQHQRQCHGQQHGGHGHVEGPLEARRRPGAGQLAQRHQRDAPDLVQAAARDGLADLVQPRHHADVGREAPAGAQDGDQVLVAPVPVADDHPADAQRGDDLAEVLGRPRHGSGRSRRAAPESRKLRRTRRPSSGCWRSCPAR